MSASLQEADLQLLASESLTGFEQRVAAIPSDLNAPFHAEARRLEAELLTVYRIVALCTKREEDLDKVAHWWGTMVGVCDSFAQRLSKLVADQPAAGAEAYYDRVLELRSKCLRLQKMHA